MALVYRRDPTVGELCEPEGGEVAIRKFQIGFEAAGCLWPFVSVRAGACGVFFLFDPPCAGACDSELGEGLTPR